jgi:hypothetical protein
MEEILKLHGDELIKREFDPVEATVPEREEMQPPPQAK